MGQVNVYEDSSARTENVICMDIRGDVHWDDILQARADIINFIRRGEGRRFDIIVNRRHSGMDVSMLAGLAKMKTTTLPKGGVVVVVGDHFMRTMAQQLNRTYQYHPLVYTAPSMREAYDIVRLSRAEQPIPLDYCAPRRG